MATEQVMQQSQLNRAKKRAKAFKVRPLQESQMYPSATSATAEERTEREALHKSRLERQRMEERKRMESFREPPLEMQAHETPTPADSAPMPYTTTQVDQARSSRTGGGINGRLRKLAEIKQRKKKAGIAEKAKQKQKQKAENMVRETIWHAFGQGGAIESEGAGMWSWFGSGGLTSIYQSLKSVLTSADNPDFLGKEGVLRFLEPNRPDDNSPGKYMTHLYSLTFVAVLLTMFTLLITLLLILGFAARAVSGTVVDSVTGAFGLDIAEIISLF